MGWQVASRKIAKRNRLRLQELRAQGVAMVGGNVKVVCEDTSDNCKFWANDGLCEDENLDTREDTLDKCPWSCGRCEKEPAVSPAQPPLETSSGGTSAWTMATAGLDRIAGPEVQDCMRPSASS